LTSVHLVFVDVKYLLYADTRRQLSLTAELFDGVLGGAKKDGHF
jgi:hypothetical protein